MKLFAIVYFAGQVSAWVGPLDVPFDDCLAFVAKQQSAYNAAVEDGLMRPDLLQFTCQYLPAPPLIAEKL